MNTWPWPRPADSQPELVEYPQNKANQWRNRKAKVNLFKNKGSVLITTCCLHTHLEPRARRFSPQCTSSRHANITNWNWLDSLRILVVFSRFRWSSFTFRRYHKGSFDMDLLMSHTVLLLVHIASYISLGFLSFFVLRSEWVENKLWSGVGFFLFELKVSEISEVVSRQKLKPDTPNQSIVPSTSISGK